MEAKLQLLASRPLVHVCQELSEAALVSVYWQQGARRRRFGEYHGRECRDREQAEVGKSQQQRCQPDPFSHFLACISPFLSSYVCQQNRYVCQKSGPEVNLKVHLPLLINPTHTIACMKHVLHSHNFML